MSADLGAVSGATVGLIGGYGDVGRKLAGQISAERPILIAGRSLEKAKAFATRLSGSISVAQLDTSVSDAAKQLAGDISIAVLMAPDPNVRFTSTCVDLGINVVWITTDFSAEEQLSALNEPAKKRGVAIVRGAGVAPGLSTLLAYDLLCKVPDARYLDFGVTLGLGEKHGGGAIDWFLSAEVPKEFGVAGRDIARFEHDALGCVEARLDHTSCRKVYVHGNSKIKVLAETCGGVDEQSIFRVKPLRRFCRCFSRKWADHHP